MPAIRAASVRRAGDASARPQQTSLWIFSGLFCAALGLQALELWKPLSSPLLASLLDAVFLLAAAATTLLALARQLPGQNVLLAAGIVAFIGGIAQAVGAVTGLPFGPFTYTRAAGPELGQTLPWSAPFIWIVVVFNSRGVARLVLRPWRKMRTYGFWLIGITAALSLLLDFTLEPFATRVKGLWLWGPTRFGFSWCGTPPTEFWGWTVVSLLALAFATPSLINKSHTKFPPDYHPLAVWILLNLLFAAGAAQHQLWPAVIAGGISVAAVTIFAVRGARW
jgi:uncharacterized membrane protein